MFSRDLAYHVEGTPEEDVLIQSIWPAQMRFKIAIRKTAPDFRPYERTYEGDRALPEVSFLDHEEERLDDDEWDYRGDAKAIFIDEVLKKATK